MYMQCMCMCICISTMYRSLLFTLYYIDMHWYIYILLLLSEFYVNHVKDLAKNFAKNIKYGNMAHYPVSRVYVFYSIFIFYPHLYVIAYTNPCLIVVQTPTNTQNLLSPPSLRLSYCFQLCFVTLFFYWTVLFNIV